MSMTNFYAHFLVDEFQAPVHRHDSLGLILLQEHWPDLLVNVRIVVEEVEFLVFLSALDFMIPHALI